MLFTRCSNYYYIKTFMCAKNNGTNKLAENQFYFNEEKKAK